MSRLREAVAGGASIPEAITRHSSGAAGALDLLELRAQTVAELGGIPDVIQNALREPGLTDLLINGPRQAWIDRGQGLEAWPQVHFADPEALRAAAVRMAAAAGRRLDDGNPIVDASLPGGVRLHAVLPPIGGAAAVISLRTQSSRAFSLDDLVESQMVHPELAPLLRTLVSQRASGLVAGATGAGKTTLLATLLGLVDPGERIVCIEEVSELRPAHPHVVHLQERTANVQASGRVSLVELVKAAMRMRPDRIVLGEARGAEIREVLSALNTGHAGSWVTLHANRAADVPARLIALGALAQASPQVVSLQAAAGLDVVLQVSRGLHGGKLRRWVSELALTELGPLGELQTVLVLRLSAPGGVLERGPGWSRFAQRWLDSKIGGGLP